MTILKFPSRSANPLKSLRNSSPISITGRIELLHVVALKSDGPLKSRHKDQDPDQPRMGCCK